MTSLFRITPLDLICIYLRSSAGPFSFVFLCVTSLCGYCVSVVRYFRESHTASGWGCPVQARSVSEGVGRILADASGSYGHLQPDRESEQFLHVVAAVHDLDGPALRRHVLLARVDAQGVAEGAEQVRHG